MTPGTTAIAQPPRELASIRKIKPLAELASLLERARQDGRRIALCHGVFDLVHPGHILHFREARKQGDLLIVTITPDRFVRKGPGRPIFNQRLRLETIAALEDVDFVALNEWPTAVETIERLKPDVYVKGQDYANRSGDLTGKIGDEEVAVTAVGGRLVLTNEEQFSSSHLINRFFSVYPDATQQYLHNLRGRYSADQLIESVRQLATLRVMIVGEAILDQYCYCIPMGKSPKETIVSTRYASEELFAGGSLAIANHVAGFCQDVTLVTLLGPDPAQHRFIESKLRPNVRLVKLVCEDRPTILKRRYLEPNFLTKMFEVQYLNDTPIDEASERRVRGVLDHELSGQDMLMVADFGHGMMSERLREAVSASDTFMALNTQSNSANLGFNPVTKYRRADFASIDEPELKLAAGTQYGDLHALGERVRHRLQAGTFLVSRGAHGSFITSQDGPVVETPALASKVIDRTGAGDALFSITAPCAQQRYAPELIGFLGNCVGALAVETVCNREPVDPVLLYKFITSLLK